MTTIQRTATAVTILAGVAIILAVTDAGWLFWLVYAIVAAGTSSSLCGPTVAGPTVYLGISQVADRIGVTAGALSRYKLPEPDVIIGVLNDDGTVPRGSFRGGLSETIDEWNANRPGCGARADLYG